MVAIVAGNGLGLENSSARLLGARGLLGNTALGRGGEQVYVNAATGNLVVQRSDELLIGRGPDAAAVRTYNSLGQYSDGDTDNWRMNTQRSVLLTGTRNTAGSKVTLTGWDGSVTDFDYDATLGKYVSKAGDGAYDTIQWAPTTGALPTWQKTAVDAADTADAGWQATNCWVWTDGAAQVMDLFRDADGKVVKRVDLDGNALTYSYDASARLQTVTTANGETTTYAYHGTTSNLWKITVNANGTQTRVTYDYEASQAGGPLDRLKRVTVDLTPENTSDSKTYWTEYTYETYNGQPSKRITRISQSDGSELNIDYIDHAGERKVWKLRQKVADGTPAPPERITQFTYFTDRTEILDPLNNTTTLYYDDPDAPKQLSRIVGPPPYSGAAPAALAAFQYDANGNVTRVTDGAGKNTDYEYANGAVTRITDPNGNVTIRDYDARNSLFRETRTGSYSNGSAISLWTRYVYDAENHLTYTISAEGDVTEYIYTTSGELSERKEYPKHSYQIGSVVPDVQTMNLWRDGLGDRSSVKICRWLYDTRGNIAQTFEYGAANAGGFSTNAEGYRFTTTLYDWSGRLLERNTFPEATEKLVYDGLDRIILSTDLTGGTTSIVFTDAATTTIVRTAMVYNATTQTWDTSASSYLTTSVYNKAGDLLSVSMPTDATTTGGNQSYAYDADGRLRKSVDASGLTRYFIYDDLGRKIADITRTAPTNPQGDLAEYRYDGEGRMIATARYTAFLNATLINQLDALEDVQIESLRPVVPDPPRDIWQWHVYDAGGRVIETMMGDGSVTKYEYDNADRLIKTTGFVNKLADVAPFKASGATIALTLPQANTALDRVTRTFYDRDGRLIGTLDGEGYLTEIAYDEAGQKVRETAYANATQATLRASGSFDELLVSLANVQKDITTRYAYDGQGFLRFAIDAIGRVTEYVYFQNAAFPAYANGRVRKTVSYETPLNLSDYSYAAVKTAAAPLQTDPDNRTSYAIYNGHGQVAYAVDAAGAVMRLEYDNQGRVIRETRFAALVADLEAAGASFVDPWWFDSWITNPANSAEARITRFYYNTRGQKRFTIDAESYVTQYDYDPEGRVVAERSWSDRINASAAWTVETLLSTAKGTAISTTYGYDWAGRLNSVWDGNGAQRFTWYHANGTKILETVAYAQGADESRIQYWYDAAGRLTAETHFTSETGNAVVKPGGSTNVELKGGERLVSANGQYSALLTREGELRVYQNGEQIWTNNVRDTVAGASYRLAAQADGRLVIYRDVGQSSTEIWGTTGSSSGATFIQMKDNGEFGLYRGTTSLWTAGPVTPASAYAREWVVKSYGYDGLGNLRWVQDFNDNITVFEYDNVGRLEKKTDALNGISTYEYDAFGRSVKAVDPRGNASFVYYDRMSRVTHTVDAENQVTETSYTAFGEVAATTHRFNKASGTPTTAAPPPASPSSLDATTRYKYDKIGRVTLMVDAENYVTETSYTSGFGEVAWVKRFYLRTTDPAGLVKPAAHSLDAVTSFEYDDLSRATKTTDAENFFELHVLDAYGNRTKTTNKSGGVTERTFDKVGRLVTETIWYDQVGGANPKTGNQYVYDRRGNLVHKVEALGAGVIERRTTYDYDKQNRLVRTVHNAVETTASATASPLQGTTPVDRFFYDRNGNLAEQRDAAGARTLFWYDKLNRVIRKVSPLGTVTRYEYDAAGNVTQMHVAATPIVLPANATGAAPSATADGANDRVTYQVYDKVGRLVRTETPNIKTGAFFADFSTAQQTIATRYDYDALGRMVRVTDANGAQTWSFYDRLGRKTSEIDAENYRTDWTYDSEGNVLSERRFAERVRLSEANLMRGGDLSQGVGVIFLEWDGGAGGHFARAIEPVDGAPALTLRKTGGVNAGGGIVYGGRIWALGGDGADGKYSVAPGETIGYAFEAKELAPGLQVRAHIVFYDAAGVAVSAGMAQTTIQADAWQRTSGVAVAPANAAYAVLMISDFRSDGVTNAAMDFALRNIQVHKLPTATTQVPAWNALPPQLESANLLRGGDLSEGTSVLFNGSGYQTAIETVDGAQALTLKKMGGTQEAWGVSGGPVIALTGDAANGKWSVSPGETVGFALAVKQLNAGDPIRVFAHLEFYNAQGGAIAWLPNTVDWDANNWERASGSAVAPEGAAYVTLRFGAYRTDTNTGGRMDFAVRKLQLHKLSDSGTAVPLWSAPIASPEDRVTSFAYDKMGRRISETRYGVDVFDPATQGTVKKNATIRFQYNALGQVTKKFEATNADLANADMVYEYDKQGRLKVEKHASFLDFNNQTVTPTIEYAYDALNNLIQTRLLGKDGDGQAGFNPLTDTLDRVTNYSYGAGGRLLSMTDAEGFARTYRYDAAGRKVREEYARIKPDGTTAYEAVGFDYDVEGRVLRQGLLTSPDGDGPWTRDGVSIDTAAMKYNAFGEISARGMIHYVGGNVSDERYAEQFFYDRAGRVWKTNLGDGVWKIFMYDAAGNQTLAISAYGTTDLSALGAIDNALALWTAPGDGDIETTNVAGVTATLTNYDARNRAIRVFEPRRELSTTQLEDLRTSRVYNAFGEVVQEANARGHDAAGRIVDTGSVRYTYNTMGRLIKTESPQVLITYANAQGQEQIDQLARPTDHLYYDISGRLVASKDANGNLTRMTLLAGTGYGGAQALTTEVWAPDDGKLGTLYDIHGQARRVRDQLWKSETPDAHVVKQTFDKLGRLIQVNKAGGLIEYFAYDGLGQRIKRWNSQYGNDLATDVERTFYDAQGRVEKNYAMGGDLTSYAYAEHPDECRRLWRLDADHDLRQHQAAHREQRSIRTHYVQKGPRPPRNQLDLRQGRAAGAQRRRRCNRSQPRILQHWPRTVGLYGSDKSDAEGRRGRALFGSLCRRTPGGVREHAVG